MLNSFVRMAVGIGVSVGRTVTVLVGNVRGDFSWLLQANKEPKMMRDKKKGSNFFIASIVKTS